MKIQQSIILINGSQLKVVANFNLKLPVEH